MTSRTITWFLILTVGTLSVALRCNAQPVADASTSSGAEQVRTSSGASEALPSSSELKEGDTANDEKTSRAVEEMLRRCGESYLSATHFHAVGRYIQAYKSTRLGENLNDASIQIFYRRPERLKIVFAGKGMEVSFVADGTTVSQLNGEKREYIQFAQPDSLAAFSEEERAGEIADDETNSIPNSIVAPLLVTPDPLAWLHSNVQQYIYGGVEDVKLVDPVTSQTSRVSCWRIKFIQSNPKIIVENWIDRETYFLRKLAIIQAVDEDANFVESYSGASRARMRVAIYDTISTSADEVPISKMRADIPKGYKFRTYEPELQDAGGGDESVWSRLVRAAAVEKGERTSVSLQAELGGHLLQLRTVHEFDSRITALQSGGAALESGPSILVGTANKQLSLITSGTTISKQLKFEQAFDQVCLLKRSAAAPLVITTEGGGDTVSAFNLDGGLQWQYRKDAAIESISTCPSNPNSFFYVAYRDGRGVRALDADGKVRFASRRLSMVSGMTAAQQTSAPVPLVVRSSSDIACMSEDLKILSRFESDTLAGPCEVDVRDAAYPLIGIGFTSADDVLLQRISREGATSWTMNLAPEASEIKGAAVDFVRIRVPDRREISADGTTTQTAESRKPARLMRCIVALLSDGRISLVTAEGDLLFRGRLTSGGTLAPRKDQWQAFGLAIGDLDGNGEDEIYTASDSQLLQLGSGDVL
ncbi:MAG: hypothetical protein ACR2IE_15190 [Candidatus Sumerlaeaceae bacterium]